MPVYGVVYAEGSKLPRRVIRCDTKGELDGHTQDGEALLVVDSLADGTLETIRAVLAEGLGLAVEDIPTGRCAVIDPKTQMVTDLIVADPALDVHHEGKEIVASDEAQINWKLDPKEGWLVRWVGGVDGKVTEVMWAPLGQEPMKGDVEAAVYIADSLAEIGADHEALKVSDKPR